MHRIESPGAEADKHGTGKDGFTEGDPVNGVAPTELGAGWHDAVQEELAKLVERSGQTIATLATDTYAQVYRAIKWMSAKQTLLHLLSDFEEVNVGSSSKQMYAVGTYTQGTGTTGGNVSVVVGGASGAIQYSDDGGANWSAATHATAQTIREVIVGGGYFYAIMDAGSVSRAPVGTLSTFSAITTGISGSTDLKGGVWVDTQSWLCVVGESGAIFTGAGGSYTSRTSGTSQHLAAADVNGDVVCACGGTTITRSDDGGATWAVVSTDGSDFLDIYYDATEATWYATDVGALYASDDDGATWALAGDAGGPSCAVNAAYGVIALCGLVAVYDSSGTANYGCRVSVRDMPGTTSIIGGVTWRSAADQLQSSHPLHFDATQGQFWLVTGKDDRVFRSKRAPFAFSRALAVGP